MKAMRTVVVLGTLTMSAVAGAANFEINVPAGTTKTITEALTGLGKTAADLAGYRIVKTGEGTLVGQTSVSTFTGTTISKGVFSADLDGAFGMGTGGTDAIYISDGGTLLLSGTTDSYNIFNRMVHLAGSGAAGMGGAIVGKRALPMYGQWILDDDAVIASDNKDGSPDAGYTKFLEMQGSMVPYIRFNGHTLTLRAVNGSTGFLWAWGMRFRVADTENGNGKMVLDGCTLAERSKTAEKFAITREARSNVTLVLTNNASFLPSSQSPISLFAGIDAENGSTIGTYWDSSVAAFGVTIGNFAGTPTFGAKISSLTITNRFTVRTSDLKADHRLTLAGPITFGDDTVLCVEGSIDGLGLKDQAHVTIAASDTSVTGVPKLESHVSSCWSVAKSSDGKSLELIYTKPAGYTDICDSWGIKTGEANAAANSTAFATQLAALPAGEAKLFLPAGEFYFAGPLSIARDDVTLTGDNGDSKIRVTGGGAVVSVNGAKNLTISQLTIIGSTGPAVAATNASALTVKNNFYSGVGGAVDGISEKYPVLAKDCTNTFVLDNYVMDGATYKAPVLHDGGTSKSGGEPVVSGGQQQCRVWVPWGKTENFFEALAKTGYAAYPASNRLVKVGGGTLIGTNTLADSKSSSSIWGVTVAEGTFSVRSNSDMGFQDAAVKDPIYVKSGATLLLDAKQEGYKIYNRVVHLAGSGAADRHGALEACGLCEVSYAQYYLDADAVMAANYLLDHVLCLESKSKTQPTNVDLQDRNLTLRSVNGSSKGFRLVEYFRLKTGGTITVDGTYFGQSSAAVVPTLDSKAVGKVKLRLANGAVFRPRTQGMVSLFASIEADSSSQVLGGEASAADFDMSIASWIGTGTVSTGISSLSITGALAFYAEDLLADAPRTMTAACSVAIGSNALMRIIDPDRLFAALGAKSARYTCATSAVSITNTPKKDSTSDFKAWSPTLSDSKTLAINAYPGMILYVR